MLDTGVFVYLERRAERLTEEHVGASGQPLISAVTFSELLVGVHRANTPERQSQRRLYAEDVLTKVIVLPFTLTTARIHAEIRAELQKRGALIGAHDLIIAATAMEHGHALLTTNRREFARIDGLDVIDFPLA